MPTGNPTLWIPSTFPVLTLAERDLAAWYFSSLPTAQDIPAPRAGAEVSDRPNGLKYRPVVSSGLALLAVAALLTTGCGSTTRTIDRQLAAAQVAAERTIADSALASDRARVAAIHAGR